MYREDEKLCLKWNKFKENTISAFGTLRKDMEFSDVTIACEDGHQVEAHRVILASSSPFFLNLLRRNKHPHPLIYMRGLKSEDLDAIVDFLYHGAANVYQENLASFLALAGELQLKGLLGSGNRQEAEEMYDKLDQKTIKPMNKKYPEQETITSKTQSAMAEIETSLIEGAVAVTVSLSLQDLDDKIKSMMMFSENKIKNGKETARICKVCGKEGQWSALRDHIEAHHITGLSHTCNICGTTTRSRQAMIMHKRNKTHH